MADTTSTPQTTYHPEPQPESSLPPIPSSPTALSSQTHSTMRHSPTQPPLQQTLTKTVLARHSTRIFHKQIPVPMSIIEECLALAQHSPSSTNIQPWRLTITAGTKLDRLSAKMMAAVEAGVPSTVPAIPDQFRHYRSAVGHVLYGPEGYGIARSDVEGKVKAERRNYEFFGAPMVATIGIDRSLAHGADVLSVGLYTQTLVLLLTERGLGTCLEVSTSGYADVLREELGIPENITILCTLSIGYEDETKHINTYKMPRDEWREHVNFVMD